MKTIAVIPCLNESRSIGTIVTKCLRYVNEVIVIDDQSTDKTVSIAFEAGAKVFQTSGTRGAGKALWLGIRAALRDKADIIVTIDGDGQHNPSDIPRLLDKCLYFGFDSAIASRFMDSETKMPYYRRLGIWLITFAYNLGSVTKLKDSQCGLRAFNRYVFTDIVIEDESFGYSTEILVKLRKAGYRVAEVPCTVFYDKVFGNNSSTNPIKHGLSVLSDTIKWRIKCELFGG